MATSTHNGAVNFHSYIESGVDPRTGTFSANILLGTLLEPDFDVRLSYSPLNQKDFGFGHGWRIPVTIYNTKTKLLSLSDGRLYEVEENNDKLTLKGNMGEVHAIRVTQPEGIKITYRDTGIVEWLQKRGNWYACSARTSPIGDAVYFRWNVEDGASPRIMLREAFKASTSFESVDDDSIEKTILLSITMKSSEVKVVFWPEKDEQRTFSLSLEKNHLISLKNTSFTPSLNWTFGYDMESSPGKLNSIGNPLGKVEAATYNSSEPLYKDAPARVEKLTTSFDEIEINDEVSDGLGWTDNYSYYLDNSGDLICIKCHKQQRPEANLAFPEQLECTAIIYESKSLLEITKIEYISRPYYDTRDPSPSRNCSLIPGELKRTVTDYSDTHYTLPVVEITTIQNLSSSNTTCKTFTWDDYGRLTQQENIAPGAVYTYGDKNEYEYRDKNGTESSLIAVHVHTDTVTQTIIEKKFEYKELEAVVFFMRSIPKQRYTALKSMRRTHTTQTYNFPTEFSEAHKILPRETLKHQEIYELTCETYNTPGSFPHGKLKQHQVFLVDSEAAKKENKPRQTTDYTYLLDSGKLTTQTTTIGFDGAAVTIKDIKSIYTNLTLTETDIDGNTSNYKWDPLSRLTGITNNPTTLYNTKETFTHGIIGSGNTYAKVFGEYQPSANFAGYIIHRDSTGRKILTGHDAYNHEVQIWVSDSLNPDDEWVLVEEKKYDSRSRVILHRRTEPHAPSTRCIEYKTVYLTPYSYWTYHERASKEYDITHTFIDEGNHIRITTYIDSNQQSHTHNHDATLMKFKKSGVFSAEIAAESINYTYGSLRSYAIPEFVCTIGKSKCWSRVEEVDLHGNVIKISIYTMDAKAEPDEGRPSRLTPVLQSFKTYTYNQQNVVTSFTDEYDNLTTFKRDTHNRPSIITRPDSSTLEYEYASHSDKPLITQLSVSSAGTTKVVGTQVFDGLERLKESQSGGRAQIFEYSGAAQSPIKTLKPNGKHLQYEVIPELGGAIKSIRAEGIEHTFEYMADSGLLREYRDQSGYTSTLTYDGQANVIQEKIVPITGQQAVTLSKSFSATGRCKEFTDAAAKQQSMTYSQGKLTTVEDAETRVETAYGAFDKIIKQTSTNKANKKTLITDFAYDILGNETSRTITTSGKKDKLVISQTLRKNNQLATRKVVDGKKVLRDEIFTYNNVDMLTEYACTGDDLPLDGYGKPISRLELTYDALSNVTQSITHFGDAKDTATFFYENAKDSCQLSRITHTHKDFEKLIELSYDANGCMTKNEKGQTLTYDSLDRLASLKDGNDTYLYHYDPKGKLTSRTKLKTRCEWYYQPGGEYPLLSNQITAQAHTRVTRMAEQVTAVVTAAGGSTASNVQLIGVDRMNSPVIVLEGDASSTHKYSPSGHPNSSLVVGQSGELYDDVGGFYHLGERQYSPRLFRFTTPDSWSPFGEAGPNCYTYLDPVNCRDPEGHLSGWAWFGIAMGVLMIVLGVVTLGASIAAMAAFGATYAAVFATIGAVATIASGAVGIAASVISESDPALSNTLEWVSFGLAVVGAVFGMSAGFAPGAARMAMRGVRAAAPRIGRAGRQARYAVQSRVVEAVEMKPLSSVISRSGVEMEMKFIGGSRYAFSTAGSVTSGLQSAMSGVFLEAIARIGAQPAIRIVGTTMGMMSLLGLGIGAKQHAQKQAAG